MKYLFTCVLTILTLIPFTSCREDFPDVNEPEKYPGYNYNEIFDAYWNGMNNNYIFWDIDTTDWDRVYREYKPLFAKLSYASPEDAGKAYTYFKKMTQGLVDSHYSLTFESPFLKDSLPIWPSAFKRLNTPEYDAYLTYEHMFYSLPGTYLDRGLRGITFSERFQYNINAMAGVRDDNILYFYCSGFNLEDLYNSPSDNDVKDVLQYFFDKLVSTDDIKGIIIDVRSNNGGAAGDLKFLLGRMVDRDYLVGYTRSKSGEGRLDYGPWTPYYLKTLQGAKNVTAPIVVLADTWSMSMAEILPMTVKVLPNGHFIGERTWGAMGPLVPNTDTNSGQFSTSFFTLVYTSSLMYKYVDNKIYEGIGFPPDIEVKYDQQAINEGRDPQFEAAVNLINNVK